MRPATEDQPANVGRMNLSWVPECVYMYLCSLRAPPLRLMDVIWNGIIG